MKRAKKQSSKVGVGTDTALTQRRVQSLCHFCEVNGKAGKEIIAAAYFEHRIMVIAAAQGHGIITDNGGFIYKPKS